MTLEEALREIERRDEMLTYVDAQLVECRNQALEEAACIVDRYGHAESAHSVALIIRALKEKP
jgi:hypothetical protein